MADLKRKGRESDDESAPKQPLKKPKGKSSPLESELSDLIIFLTALSVDNLLPQMPPSTKTYWKGIVTAHRSETLLSVLAKCTENNILSVPVLKGENKYSGFVDMLDLIYAVSSVFPETPGKKESEESTTPSDLLQTNAAFKEMTIQDMLEFPYLRRHPDTPIKPGYSLFHAIEVLSRENSHRVPIVTEEGRISNVITQSMVIDLVADRAEMMSRSILDTHVQKLIDIGTITTHVLRVKKSEKTLTAFRTMAENQISALPVVDEDGGLVDVLSIRDLRAIGKNGVLFYRLWDTVENFKILAREDYKKQTPSKMILVTPSSLSLSFFFFFPSFFFFFYLFSFLSSLSLSLSLSFSLLL